MRRILAISFLASVVSLAVLAVGALDVAKISLPANTAMIIFGSSIKENPERSIATSSVGDIQIDNDMPEGIVGPGGCGTGKECGIYCSELKHRSECDNFKF